MKQMKKYLLFIISMLCAVTGAWATPTTFGDHNSTWEVKPGSTMVITLGDGDRLQTLINSWTEDNPDALLLRISFTNRVHNNRDSRAWLTDTKYIRLKNIEVGYTINKPKFVPLLNSVRFFVNAQNLLTFTDFKGNDPEADGGNFQYGIKYPMTRVFNFGVKVNF